MKKKPTVADVKKCKSLNDIAKLMWQVIDGLSNRSIAAKEAQVVVSSANRLQADMCRVLARSPKSKHALAILGTLPYEGGRDERKDDN